MMPLLFAELMIPDILSDVMEIATWDVTAATKPAVTASEEVAVRLTLKLTLDT